LRSDVDWDALARYFAGECSEPEAAAMREWLASNPAEAARFAAIESAVVGISSELRGNVDAEAALRNVTARLDQGPRVVPGGAARRVASNGFSPSLNTGSRTWRTPLLAAAAIGVIALGAVVLRGRGTPGSSPTDVAPRAVMTGVGQRDSIRLADGSRVLLGPMSHVTILPDYGAKDRVIELRGEALFDVVHDAARPFVVRAGSAMIRDIGTTFSVRATDSTDVRVVVTAGSVQLASTTDSQGVLLKAGDVGTLRAGQAPKATPRTATDEDIAWTKGRLSFRNAPLTMVRDELRRWYGIQLVLADSTLQKRTLNTTFVRESPEQAVRIIEMTLGVRVEMRGDTAIVHGMTGAPRR
jgi:transmembrane sensor